VPLRIRNGIGANPVAVLLTRDGQSMPSGRCDEPLSVNADAIGFYRVSYDTATLAQNLKHFADLPTATRSHCSMINGHWSNPASKAYRRTCLALRWLRSRQPRMGTDRRDTGRIEYDVRGAAGHDAFVTHAKSIVQQPHSGWAGSPGRRIARCAAVASAMIEDLVPGRYRVIDQARARFTHSSAITLLFDPTTRR